MNKLLTAEVKEARKGEALTRWGMKLTKVYFILLLAFFPAASVLGWIDWKPMALNEIGDLLAGIFGPLSIFWIVLGFMQQGGELRLQVEELARSVEQQKELVSVSRETLDHERDLHLSREQLRRFEMLPRFLIYGTAVSSFSGPDGWIKHKIRITNAGGPATDVRVKTDPRPVEGSFPFAQYMAKGYIFEQEIKFLAKGKIENGTMSISYHDDEGTRHRIDLIFERSKIGLLFKEVMTSQEASK